MIPFTKMGKNGEGTGFYFIFGGRETKCSALSMLSLRCL